MGMGSPQKTCDTERMPMAASTDAPDSTDARDYLSLAEFARRAGISTATVCRRIKDGSLPFWQPGGFRTRVLIPVSALPSANAIVANGTPSRSPVAASSPVHKPNLSGPPPKWQKSLKK